MINFTTGCVGRHFATWQKLTIDKDFLSSSSGTPAENCNEDFLAIGTKFFCQEINVFKERDRKFVKAKGYFAEHSCFQTTWFV